MVHLPDLALRPSVCSDWQEPRGAVVVNGLVLHPQFQIELEQREHGAARLQPQVPQKEVPQMELQQMEAAARP